MRSLKLRLEATAYVTDCMMILMILKALTTSFSLSFSLSLSLSLFPSQADPHAFNRRLGYSAVLALVVESSSILLSFGPLMARGYGLGP